MSLDKKKKIAELMLRSHRAMKDCSPEKQEKLKAIMKECSSAYQSLGEAANLGQQAAIAIKMKKQGKKPKHVDEAESRTKKTAQQKLGKAWDQAQRSSEASRIRADRAREEFNKAWDKKKKSENVTENDDWDDGEWEEIENNTAPIKKQPAQYPDSVLRAIERNPSMRADIIADYERKQGVAEGTPRHFGPQGAGTELARQIRANGDLDRTKEPEPTNVPKKNEFHITDPKAKIQVKKNKGVAEDATVTPDGVSAGTHMFLSELDLEEQSRKTKYKTALERWRSKADKLERELEQIEAQLSHTNKTVDEGQWGGSGPGGLKAHYAVYKKENGRVSRVKDTNKFGEPMNPREAEAYAASMIRNNPGRYNHDNVWIAGADIELDEGRHPKDFVQRAADAAKKEPEIDARLAKTQANRRDLEMQRASLTKQIDQAAGKETDKFVDQAKKQAQRLAARNATVRESQDYLSEE